MVGQLHCGDPPPCAADIKSGPERWQYRKRRNSPQLHRNSW